MNIGQNTFDAATTALSIPFKGVRFGYRFYCNFRSKLSEPKQHAMSMTASAIIAFIVWKLAQVVSNAQTCLFSNGEAYRAQDLCGGRRCTDAELEKMQCGSFDRFVSVITIITCVLASINILGHAFLFRQARNQVAQAS